MLGQGPVAPPLVATERLHDEKVVKFIPTRDANMKKDEWPTFVAQRTDPTICPLLIPFFCKVNTLDLRTPSPPPKRLIQMKH